MMNNKCSEEFLKTQGNQAFHKKEYQKAATIYSTGIKKFPRNPTFYLNRSLAYLTMHFYQEALEDLIAAKSLDPKNPKIYYRTALALQLIGDYEKAIEVLSEFLSTNVQNSEISELFAELQVKKVDYRVGPEHPERKIFEELFKWTSLGGGEFPKINIEYYSHEYRGVHCNKEISEGESIIFVPYSHIISTEVVENSPLVKTLKKSNFQSDVPHQNYFSVYLLEQQSNPNSFWTTYLKVLPKNFNNSPLFYTEEEKKLLTGSPFLYMLRERFEELEKGYQDICKIDNSFAKYSFNDFIKVRLVACSRLFAFLLNDRETHTLIPVADMINHDPKGNSSWFYSTERNGFTIKAERTIARNESISFSYGSKCNSIYLLNYGFLIENNSFDEFPFNARLLNTNPHYVLKMTYLRQNYKMFKLRADIKDQDFLDLLSCLRFFEETDGARINEFFKKCIENNDEINPIKYKPYSLESEKLVLRKFMQLTEFYISKFPTTLAADKEKLKQPLSDNERNITLLLIGQKEILSFYQNILPSLYRTLEEILKMSSSELNPSLRYYIENIIVPIYSTNNS